MTAALLSTAPAVAAAPAVRIVAPTSDAVGGIVKFDAEVTDVGTAEPSTTWYVGDLAFPAACVVSGSSTSTWRCAVEQDTDSLPIGTHQMEVRATSTAIAGYISAVGTVTIQRTPSELKLLSPASGGQYDGGPMRLAASRVSGTREPTWVRWYLDGALLGSGTTSGDYGFTWDSCGKTGMHFVRVDWYDEISGFTTSSPNRSFEILAGACASGDRVAVLADAKRASASTVAPGDVVAVNYLLDPEVPAKTIGIYFDDPTGGTKELRIEGAPLPSSGQLSAAVDSTWPNGTYRLRGVVLIDATAAGTYSGFSRDGSVAKVPASSPGPTYHLIDLAALDFSVSTATNPTPTDSASPAPSPDSGTSTPPAQVSRLSGPDRLGTAAAISKDAWMDQAAQSVVLARYDAFPDALAGTPLAVRKNGPLLLTPSTGLNAGIAAEIKRVLPTGRTVYLLGGTAALSQGVADAVTRLGYKVARLGGADRYATAVTISKQLGTPSRIFEATGLSFQNALISGVAAASTGGVVVLTADAKMPAATNTYLDSFPSVERVAVGPQAGTADPSATKLAGTTVYDTARLVAERFFPTPRAAALASGTVFADALSGGAHIGRLGGPLLLSEPTRLPAPIAGYLSATQASIDTATLYGGPVALSTAVDDGVRANLRQ